MAFIRVYSIIVVLLLLVATAANERSEIEDIVMTGLMLVPVLVYLLYGG